MNGNLSIDVSILAVMLAMYITKQDDKMIIGLMLVLVSHLFITMDDHLYEDEDDVQIQNSFNVVGDQDFQNIIEVEKLGVTEDETPVEQKKVIVEPVSTPVSLNQQSKTVSNGVFSRQLSTPQTNLTSSIFPKSSSEANGKLADARGSFFKSLVS
jgi:hypothetical protein